MMDLTPEEKRLLTCTRPLDEIGAYDLEELVRRDDGEEPPMRHVFDHYNSDGSATMKCGLTVVIGTVEVGSLPPRFTHCAVCKRFA